VLSFSPRIGSSKVVHQGVKAFSRYALSITGDHYIGGGSTLLLKGSLAGLRVPWDSLLYYPTLQFLPLLLRDIDDGCPFRDIEPKLLIRNLDVD